MNLQTCGKISVLILALVCITQSAEASKKKKRVIVKVPSRIKHIYHHHTKNLHIHKGKPIKTEYKNYDSYRSPVPYSGGRKRSPPWRDEKIYEDDYGYDEYDYGNYGYGGWGEDKARYKDKRSGGGGGGGGGYDYEAPKRNKWSDGKRSPLIKGYSAQSKRSPHWKNSRRAGPKKYRDMFEGAATALWPEVKEHDSWHQARPQGFKQSARIIPADQYHDTSIHAIDYADKQSSNIHTSIASYNQPLYQNNQRPQQTHSFDRPIAESSEVHPYEHPQAEPLHHPPSHDYHQSQPSDFHPVLAQEYPKPTPSHFQTDFEQPQPFDSTQFFLPHQHHAQ